MRKWICLILVAVLLLPSGCHSIRRKFSRKKQAKEQPPVYIDFKEYPAQPTKEMYETYAVFTRSWMSDLIQDLNEDKSYKRQRRAIREIIKNLEQIMYCYNQAGKEKISPLYEELKAIQKDIERNSTMNSVKRNILIHKLEHLKREFESNFNYKDAQPWMTVF